MRYIGSKRKVLPFIKEAIEHKVGSLDGKIVADLFAGTACVGATFKEAGAKVITNDYLSFSYALQVAKIKLNNMPDGQIAYGEALQKLNSLNGTPGFFYHEYSQEGTREEKYIRNYFSADNAKKIDAIRLKLNEWLDKKIISQNYFYCLCASLVDAITKVSNTSGTYGAFLKIDDSRKNNKLILKPINFINNSQENECYCNDIFQVIEQVSGDILYLDPPYNNRQYPPYYHILETAVKYDYPKIYGKTGRRPYESQMSPFCIKNQVNDALLKVIEKSDFEHIFMSYSTDGIANLDQIIEILSSNYYTELFSQTYRRYKSNSNEGEVGNKQKLKEIILYVRKR